MNNNQKLKEFLQEKKSILITTHVRPDGDAIGSSLALYIFLKNAGHKVMLAFPTSYASVYNWFPEINESKVFSSDEKEILNFTEQADIIFVVDFNQLSRNGDFGKILSKSKKTKVLIDHHPEPEDIFDYHFWTTKYSAAAEGIYDFIKLIDENGIKNLDIATCLYAAIVFDTGSFRYQSVSKKTHTITADLFEAGIDHDKIQQHVNDNFTENRMKLWGYCLNDKLTILHKSNAAYISLSKEEFANFDAKAGYTEGLVNLPLGIENIEISVLIVEKEEQIKLSFRSKTNFPVNKFAKQYFNGGGHRNAAGGESKLSLEKTIKLFEEKVKLEMGEYSL
ncbi:MAG: bifunctional oligoribonuclease/PAP phosphatase NrnA [Bacteroidota bacterium]|nr:bifunctional oligoribonuclease/PAP phosphatase NrnA [Bacteroidota bacterium]